MLFTLSANSNGFYLLNFLVISLIFIENKMLSPCDMRFEKGEKKVRQKVGVDRVKKTTAHALPSAPLSHFL